MKNEIKVASSLFDRVSRVYDTFLNLFTLGLINKWQNTLVKKTPLNEKVLDVGTGTGELIKKVKKHKSDTVCVGIDVSYGMLLKAKEKLKNEEDVYFLQADIYNSPFKDKSIDNVLLSLTFRHLEHERFIKEINRILKNGGYISIFDTGKIRNRFIWSTFLFLLDKPFRPFGYLFFSKQEYDYFIDSIKKSVSMEQLIKLFKSQGYTPIYSKKVMFGFGYIVVLRKEK